MKKLQLFLILIISISKLSGQDFAPTGATWYYSRHFVFHGDIEYFKIESVKDTIVNAIDCKKLLKNNPLGCTGQGDTEIVYQADSMVYFFDSNFNEFQVLYNLRAEKESSWFIKIMDYDKEVDTLFVTVDSTNFLEINSRFLKRLFVTYNGTHNGDTIIQYPSQIIETIGDIYYLFNIYPNWSGACDDDYSGGLRCYQDQVFGSYETGIADSCTYTYTWNWNGIENISSVKYYQIFPNPTNEKLQINVDNDNILMTLELFDLFGKQILLKDFISDTVIDLSGLPNGFYFVSIKNADELFGIEKIIKN